MPERSTARGRGRDGRRPVRARARPRDDGGPDEQPGWDDDAERDVADQDADAGDRDRDVEDRDRDVEDREQDADAGDRDAAAGRDQDTGRDAGRRRARDEEPEPESAPAAAAGRRDRAAADGLTAADAARAAVRTIVDLIGKRPEGITAVEPTEDGWLVGVEVLEDQRVPSSADILAIYEAELGPDGGLLSYRRGRRYSRGQGDRGEDR